MSGKDVLALEPKERPNCVYEEQEYNALTFFLGKKVLPDGISTKEKPLASPAAGAADDAVHSREGDAPGEPRASDKRAGSAGASPSHVSTANASGQSPLPDDSGLSPSHAPASSSSDAAASDDDYGFSLPTFSFPKEKVGEESAATPLLHHNIAMYQVMLTRAQAALAVARLIDDTIAQGERYSMKSSKVGALLQAQIRIGRELRQWIRLLANDAVRFALGLGPAKPEEPEPEEPEEELSLPDMMVPILKKAEGVLEHALRPRRPKPDPSTA